MRVTEIVVSAGRTFNHPYESYANLKPQVTLKATLDEGEDSSAAVKELQAQAEQLVEQHKLIMLSEIRRLKQLQDTGEEVANLQEQIRRAQAALSRLRRENPEVFAELPATVDQINAEQED